MLFAVRSRFPAPATTSTRGGRRSDRLRLRSQVNELFKDSRAAAGSRSIVTMLRDRGTQVGRFKVRAQMRESGLICKQPGTHKYKQATVERPDIANRLDREFDVDATDQVWSGDITYIWAQGRWHYLVRFATERVYTVNTVATGGNAELLAIGAAD